MGVFDSFRRGSQYEAEPEGHRGYFSLDDRAGEPDYDDWDARLGAVDTALAEEERRRTRWFQPSHWRGRRKRWWAVRIFAALLALFIALVAWLAITAPLNKSLRPVAPPQITLLASDGTPIARNGAITDEPVDVDTLPPHVVEAFLAIEDRRFYSHWGVDPRGIARAAITGTGGGSTITQQLAKFTFLTPERSLTRKAREALIAFWLEAWLTKDEILERYLSNANFGDDIYGLRAASLYYFYRQPENLTVQQAALLAGLVQRPNWLHPVRHYDRAEERMRLVLNAMAEEGYITRAEANGPAPRLDVRAKKSIPTGTYFADWALPQARAVARGEGGGGYARQTITTTLDSRLQEIARQVVRDAPLQGAQVGLVAMRPNGEVVAMLGGTDYGKTPFNRVTQARRQPGSTFKLFVYLAALRNGWEPDDTISNKEISEGSYRPKNSGGRYSDTITLADAFARSSNVAAVRLMGEVGSDKVIETARDLGVTSPMTPGDPSLALGTSTMSLMQLTAAYAGVAANAMPVEPHALPKEEAGFWRKLWDGPKHLSGRVHDDMQALLRQAVNKGTGRAAMLPVANYGKTGTTQDNRDALFVGYAGDLVVGVWVGRDDNSPLGRMSGGTVPARIWKNFMTRALRLKPAAAPRVSPPAEEDPDIGDIILNDGDTVIELPGGRIRIDRDGPDLVLPDYDMIRDRVEEERARVEERYERARERQEELEEAR